MKYVKPLFVFCLLGAFGAAIAGCEARAKVGDPDSNTGTSYKKETTTVREPDGDVRKVETKVERNP